MSSPLADVLKIMADMARAPPPPPTIVIWALAPDADPWSARIAGRSYMVMSRQTWATVEARCRRDERPDAASLYSSVRPMLGVPVVEFETLPELVQASLYLARRQLEAQAP